MTDSSNDFRAAGPRRPNSPRRREGAEARARRPLRDVVCEIDRDILRLLLRRTNLLTKMRGAKPRLEAAEEKALREAWEAAVARVSRDARLSGHFFSLMQEVEFLPRPAAHDEADAPEGAAAREPQHTAFNLAPAPKPVRLRLAAPLACRATRAWLMLAAASGQALRLEPCLMNDPIVDCVKMLNQAGAALTREDDGVTARQAAPLGAPDKVLHAGDSAWNFFLLLGHYLGRPSRAKFTGEAGLKLANFSAVRHFLPTLGARLVPVVPKSEGLPARLECSGILPDSVSLPADVPAELAESLLLAAPGYEQGLTLDLAAHAEREHILARMMPILRAAGADAYVEGTAVRVHPGPLQLPERPEVDMEPELALFLLALPLALGGEVRLAGRWSALPAARAGWDALHRFGLDLRMQGADVLARSKAPLKTLPRWEPPADFPAAWSSLPLALTACSALRGGEAALPVLPAGTDMVTAESFLHAVGLEHDGTGILRKISQDSPRPAWNAPNPVWALALALTACASPHQKLGNPGVMTELYPAFWALYNSLPEPGARSARKAEEPATATRRRIITDVVAVAPPENRDDED